MKRKISEITPSDMAKEARGLKQELQRLVKQIIREHDYGKGIVQEAIDTMVALKELRFMKITSFYSKRKGTVVVPEEFLCPISGELMKDPVIVASGETYDRKFIQRWFCEVDLVCPRTKQVLYNTVLTPNSLVRKIIIGWCKRTGIEPPNLDSDEDKAEVVDPPRADRAQLAELLEKMSSSSLTVQKEAAKEIRKLTSEIVAARGLLIESSNDIFQLLNPLLSGSVQVDPGLREDLIITVYNVSVPKCNKKKLADCPAVLPILNESLLHGTFVSRGFAAAALGTLAMLKTYDVLIGNSGALKNLIALLKDWERVAISEANQALYILCLNARNREKAIEEGLVWAVLEKILNRVSVKELLPMLSVHVIESQKGVEEMVRLGAVPLLFELIREESWSDKVRERCVLIILLVCAKEESAWKEVAEEEARFQTISRLSERGTQRVRVNAAAMLRKLKGDSFVLPQQSAVHEVREDTPCK